MEKKWINEPGLHKTRNKYLLEGMSFARQKLLSSKKYKTRKFFSILNSRTE